MSGSMGHKGYRLKMIIYRIKRRLRPVYWRIKGEFKDITFIRNQTN
jgi:hypothetical protein